MSMLEQPSAKRPAPAAAPLARVALLGAGGYTGQVFARLALAHPHVSLATLVSRERQPAHTLLPGIERETAAALPVLAPDALAACFTAGGVDVLVSALPHGALAELSRPHRHWRPRQRLGDRPVGRPSRRTGWAYGLPEAFRPTLADATRIANPGCYPTAATLAAAARARSGARRGSAHGGRRSRA